MHQPVLLVSEEVNFHASGWTMWTARFCSSDDPGASTLSQRQSREEGWGDPNRRDVKNIY